MGEIQYMIKLLQGDCLELMKELPDKSIDMVLCDLPFGVTQNKWDKIIPFESLWGEYNRVVKENGAIVLNCQQPFTSKLIMSNLKNFKYCWVWYKKQCSGFLMQRNNLYATVRILPYFIENNVRTIR